MIAGAVSDTSSNQNESAALDFASRLNTTETKVDWFSAALIVAFAGFIRLAFFSGGLGTDEIVYITQAYRVLHGDFTRATYLGAVRYGINAFQALSLRLFGNGVVGADGLFFACSLGGILLAYWFAHRLWGRGAAAWTALALAVLPLDVTLAGSLNPDSYLALTIAASIIAFYFANESDHASLYFLAGLLAGWVFWIKEEVIIYGFIFVFLALSDWHWRPGLRWFLFGGFLCLVADLIFFWTVYGDPLYQYGVVHRTVGEQIATRTGESSPWAYLRYLFVDVYHTGLLGWLALGGIVLAFRSRTDSRARFVLVWGIGLLLIFSVFPISFRPLEFILKQSNYIEIFVMPFTLLAGWFLANQRRDVAFFLGGAMVVSGITLSALEQQVVRVVTVNGRSAVVFAKAHAGTPVFGPPTAWRQSAVERLLHGSLDSSGDIHPVAEFSRVSYGGGPATDIVAYVVDDPQMRNWPGVEDNGPIAQRLRDCVTPVAKIGQTDLGLGRYVLAALRNTLSLLPGSYAAAARRATEPLWQVAPAQVYAVTRACAQQGRVG